jgi:FMN phosphatase YigB (HAD superfamily)
MSIRAVIFDVYKTLLEVGPAPEDADDRWRSLWREQLQAPPRVTLAEFGTACLPIITREHAAARLAGIPFPEIYWPSVTTETLPELAQVPLAMRDDFLFRHAQMVRTLRLAPDAAETLGSLHASRIPMGIASNAQPYTLRELDAALEAAGLSRELFRADLCFWSFEHGFSKPDPHVFRLLTARLAAIGISCAETLMVGDRIDNDILPARAQGWRTWHLDPGADGAAGGGWEKLRRWLG